MRRLLFLLAVMTALAVFADRRTGADAKIVSNRLLLDDSVCETMENGLRRAVVANAPSDAVVYLDVTGERAAPPDGAVVADLGDWSITSSGRQTAGYVLVDGRAGGTLPVIVRFSSSEQFGPEDLRGRNALGIRCAGDEDAVTQKANQPWYLLCRGGSSESVALARLAVAAIRALPPDICRYAREDGMTWLTALTLLRRAQTAATDGEAYLSGACHGPFIGSVDEAKLLRLAAAQTDSIVPPPVFTDILCDDLEPLKIPGASAFAVTSDVESISLRLKIATVRYATPVWRVLADAENDVSLTATEGLADVRIMRNGRAGRVDIGCFAVAGPDDASIPIICSIWLPERRAPLPAYEIAVSNLSARGYCAADAFRPTLRDAWRAKRIRFLEMAFADLPHEIRTGEELSENDRRWVVKTDMTKDGLDDLLVARTDGVALYARIRKGGYRRVDPVLCSSACLLPCGAGNASAGLLVLSPVDEHTLQTKFVRWENDGLVVESLSTGPLRPEDPVTVPSGRMPLYVPR